MAWPGRVKAHLTRSGHGGAYGGGRPWLSVRADTRRKLQRRAECACRAGLPPAVDQCDLQRSQRAGVSVGPTRRRQARLWVPGTAGAKARERAMFSESVPTPPRYRSAPRQLGNSSVRTRPHRRSLTPSPCPAAPFRSAPSFFQVTESESDDRLESRDSGCTGPADAGSRAPESSSESSLHSDSGRSGHVPAITAK
jgi:hypothetical protein